MYVFFTRLRPVKKQSGNGPIAGAHYNTWNLIHIKTQSHISVRKILGERLHGFCIICNYAARIDLKSSKWMEVNEDANLMVQIRNDSLLNDFLRSRFFPFSDANATSINLKD